MYNYFEAVCNDVREYINDNINLSDWEDNLGGIDISGLSEHLNNELWAEDSVTGNASGSYTFSTWTAEEYLSHNWDILANALEEFGQTDVNPIDKGAEWCDVTIRCYLLGEAIDSVLEDIKEEWEETHEYIPLF